MHLVSGYSENICPEKLGTGEKAKQKRQELGSFDLQNVSFGPPEVLRIHLHPFAPAAQPPCFICPKMNDCKSLATIIALVAITPKLESRRDLLSSNSLKLPSKFYGNCGESMSEGKWPYVN